MSFDGLGKIKDMTPEEAETWILNDMRKTTRQTVFLTIFGILALVLAFAFAGR